MEIVKPFSAYLMLLSPAQPRVIRVIQMVLKRSIFHTHTQWSSCCPRCNTLLKKQNACVWTETTFWSMSWISSMWSYIDLITISVFEIFLKKTLHSVYGDTHGRNKLIDSGEIPCNKKAFFPRLHFISGTLHQNKRGPFDPINIFNIFSHQCKSREVGFKPLDMAPTQVKVIVGQETH